jgi:hypothetical protein
MFIPFSVPVYPILGSLSTAAMVATVWLTTTLGISSGFRIIAVAVVGYAAMLGLAPIERAASRSKAYRTLRTVIRVLVCAVLIVALINAPERELSRANALGLAVIGVQLVFFAARQFDRVLRLGGAPKAPPSVDGTAPSESVTTPSSADPAALEPGSARRVEWRDAAFFGLIPALIGFFIGRDGGVFLGASFWLLTVGIVVGWRYLRRGALRVVSSTNSADAKRGSGGMLRTSIIVGAVLGTAGGALLLASSGSGHVEVADLVAFAAIGVVIAVIFRFVRRAFASRGDPS